MPRRARLCHRSFCILLLVLIAAWQQPTLAMSCADSLLNSVPVTQALLSGHWEQVFSILSTAKTCSLNSNAALLHGHAALATGNHNLAAATFALVQDSIMLTAWRKWTSDFSAKHPNSACGHYLLGDAKARLGDFKGATSEFDLTLERDSRYYLARNARGVLKAISYQSSGKPAEHHELIAAATQDFDDVVSAQPKFADALINRAVANIEAMQMDGARKDFDQAGELTSFRLAFAKNKDVTCEPVFFNNSEPAILLC